MRPVFIALFVAILFALSSISSAPKALVIGDTTIYVKTKFFNGEKLKGGESVSVEGVIWYYPGNVVLKYANDTTTVPDTLRESRVILIKVREVIVVSDESNINFKADSIYNSGGPDKNGNRVTVLPLTSAFGEGKLKIISHSEYGVFCVIIYPNGVRECVYAFRK